MPVRITCPSCSATLSVRDEFAGRAVKCPKCAGVIPPQEAPATVSEPQAVATVPPPPEPQPAPPEEAEKPAARESDDRDDDRPRKKRRDDDEDDDRPRRRRRDDDDDRDERDRRDDDYDDRPRRKRRDDDDDDDDDRPRRKRRRDDEDDRPRDRRQAQGGSNFGLIVAGGAVVFCLIAVIVGVVVYSQREAENKAVRDAEKAEKEALAAKAAASGQTSASYDKVKIGDTRAQADTALGKSGRTATAEDLAKVFKSSGDRRKLSDWTPKAKDGRVILWQSGEDSFVLVLFHPNPDASGRVQAKALRTKSEDRDSGDLNDAAFLKRFPSKEGEPKMPPKGEPPP